MIGLFLDLSYGWVINDINTKMLPKDLFSNELSDEEIIAEASTLFKQRISLIFPGTKWCGAGNVADNYDDLGEEKEADMCCREHDNCPDLIPGGETKHNLTNDAFYTRLSCACDEKFLTCLRSANTKVARYIGLIYFDGLQTKCYREDYPVIKCIKKGGWFKTKCVQYSYDKSGEKIYQWFDVEDF
uniref:Phospholipase A2 n=1 Tax=Spodoptera exigua TaxID=7107 RepID=A0A3Q8U958_SPOEX|nr:phospholipase 2 [Spodoptera exigua]